MRKSEKTAIFRVFTDLIKADDIIDIKEIDFLDELREKYGITKECEITAGSLTLAKALKTIATADKKTRHSLMNDFIRVAMSDDFCAKEEALLLIGLRLLLTINSQNISILSVDSSIISFDSSQILYIESEYDNKTNEQINKLFRELCAEVRLFGFELVYLPKISEHYNSIAEADLLRIAEFLYPKVSTERIHNIVKQIQNLSTASFCNEQLATKFAIEELRTINPSS